MRQAVIAALCAALSGAAFPAFGWGPDGHQTVGKIADQVIAGAPAGTQVATILGGMTLQQASVWADCAKGVVTGTGDYQYQPKYHDPACKVHETPDGIEAMRDYVRRNDQNCTLAPGDEETCHKVYHYADVAIRHSAYKRGLVGTSDHDVTAAIAACVAVLKGDAAPAPFNIKDKREALLLLAHFAGDVHQPLHVGAVYLDGKGRQVNPDSGTYDPQTKTDGGKCAAYRGEEVARHVGRGAAVFDARAAERQHGCPGADGASIDGTGRRLEPGLGQRDYDSRAAGVCKGPFRSQKQRWNWSATLPASYAGTMDDIKDRQTVTAGARLAQALQVVWP